jgi:hypothetical protein
MSQKVLRTFLFLVSLIALSLLSGCVIPEHRESDSSGWVTTVEKLEYVRNDTVNIGPIKIPLRTYEWEVVEAASNSTEDRQPPEYVQVDCGEKEEPVHPAEGDTYCRYSTEYFLTFGEDRAQISKEVWENYTPDTVYTVYRESGIIKLMEN